MNRKWIFLLGFLFIFSGCREKADLSLHKEFMKEYLQWSYKGLKMENEALEVETKTEYLLDSINAAGNKKLADSLGSRLNEWTIGFDRVSDKMDAFLDQCEQGLDKLEKEGMAKDDANKWWSHRREIFNEIEKEAEGLRKMRVGE